MPEYLLSRRYYSIGKINPFIEVNPINIRFVSNGAYISESGRESVFLNPNALKKLYEILKKRSKP